LTNALSNQKKSSSKKKRGLLGRVFRFLVIFSLSLIVLFINLLFILQIPFVKNKLLDFSISKINSSLKDKECVLNIENLEGNLFSTIKLNNINFVVKNDTLFKANSIEVKFILFPIINKKINISDLIIDK
jgi:hypothetical protein